MKWLVDNQLPVALARHLREAGEDAVHVLEIGRAQTSDRLIWEYALEENRIVVTKDEDFSALLVHSPRGQVVWVRIGNCRKSELIMVWERAWPEARAALAAGQRLVVLV
ncbi:hypothetical protein ASA1KI_42560 [Opitutales bacterium ASA1]|uniref:DUF5615 family PIN-like protein n=1 Tax=Congregicoccus parvus TaxID=3081749 RepID=UPI002B2D583A|nr:hypothetical protein ASA1KI_42560 [Opitutales bacterium ASA1]